MKIILFVLFIASLGLADTPTKYPNHHRFWDGHYDRRIGITTPFTEQEYWDNLRMYNPTEYNRRVRDSQEFEANKAQSIKEAAARRAKQEADAVQQNKLLADQAALDKKKKILKTPYDSYVDSYNLYVEKTNEIRRLDPTYQFNTQKLLPYTPETMDISEIRSAHNLIKVQTNLLNEHIDLVKKGIIEKITASQRNQRPSKAGAGRAIMRAAGPAAVVGIATGVMTDPASATAGTTQAGPNSSSSHLLDQTNARPRSNVNSTGGFEAFDSDKHDDANK